MQLADASGQRNVGLCASRGVAAADARSVRHTPPQLEDRLGFEPLIIPGSIRLLRADEVPVHDDRDSILEKLAAEHRAHFVAGYVLTETGSQDDAASAEINAHAPAVWRTFRELQRRISPRDRRVG